GFIPAGLRSSPITRQLGVSGRSRSTVLGPLRSQTGINPLATDKLNPLATDQSHHHKVPLASNNCVNLGHCFDAIFLLQN
ncbi:hypothetical protein, partial [Pseudomonas tehranensis]|uniref:hypothetical protein n=1 Tax=Pseudomonas tehranensis TaxID=2745502 RepID=UPI001CD8D7A2